MTKFTFADAVEITQPREVLQKQLEASLRLETAKKAVALLTEMDALLAELGKRQLAAFPPPAGEQEGWQLVPTKHGDRAGLTHEMCDAFWNAFNKASEHRGHYESTNAGYNALLAAVPERRMNPVTRRKSETQQ